MNVSDYNIMNLSDYYGDEFLNRFYEQTAQDDSELQLAAFSSCWNNSLKAGLKAAFRIVRICIKDLFLMVQHNLEH